MLETVVVGTLSAQQQLKPVLNNYTHVVAKPCIAVKGNDRVLMAVQALSKIYRQLKYCKMLLRFVCMYMNLSTDIITLTELISREFQGFTDLHVNSKSSSFGVPSGKCTLNYQGNSRIGSASQHSVYFLLFYSLFYLAGCYKPSISYIYVILMVMSQPPMGSNFLK